MKLCEFCQLPNESITLMCKRCSKSYDAHLRTDDGTLNSVLVWAARRARYFERVNQSKNKSRKP